MYVIFFFVLCRSWTAERHNELANVYRCIRIPRTPARSLQRLHHRRQRSTPQPTRITKTYSRIVASMPAFRRSEEGLLCHSGLISIKAVLYVTDETLWLYSLAHWTTSLLLPLLPIWVFVLPFLFVFFLSGGLIYS